MTPPRRVLPGTTYLVTRRCSERRFFLKPSAATNEIVLYVLAIAAQRYRILVHAFCFLSNHCHLIVTDQDARLPAFMQYIDSLIARAVNSSLGRFEGFWATDGSYSAIEPLDPADVLAKTAYVLANPVAAGLVRRGDEWPGLWTAPDQIGAATLEAARPGVFFDPKGQLPKVARLALAAPPGFATAAEFRALVSRSLRELEDHHQQAAAAQGRRFLGAARVLAQSPFSHPARREPRFQMKPRVSGRDRWKRAQALFRVDGFERAYWNARDAWRAGVRDALFPAGTYLLRIMHGVMCAGAA